MMGPSKAEVIRSLFASKARQASAQMVITWVQAFDGTSTGTLQRAVAAFIDAEDCPKLEVGSLRRIVRRIESQSGTRQSVRRPIFCQDCGLTYTPDPSQAVEPHTRHCQPRSPDEVRRIWDESMARAADAQ